MYLDIKRELVITCGMHAANKMCWKYLGWKTLSWWAWRRLEGNV